MAKFLIEAVYTVEGAKGLARDGGTGRRAAISAMIEGLGGKLEAFYYCFGEADCIIIADLPDNAAAAAVAIAVGAAGGASLKTTVLLSPEEVDAAGKRSVNYRKPGG